MTLLYPTREDIELWAEVVAQVGQLQQYLPIIDEQWVDRILGDFQLTLLHPDGNDLRKVAARLFYRIIKNHHFPDGNKRSAVINIGLFVFMNHHQFTANPHSMYMLAKHVAATDSNAEMVIALLATQFQKTIVPLEGQYGVTPTL